MEQIEIVSILIIGLILAYFIFKTLADFIDMIRGGQKKPNKFDDRNITFQNGSIGLEKKQYPHMYENDDFRYKLEPVTIKKIGRVYDKEFNDVAALTIVDNLIYGTVHQRGGGLPRVSWTMEGKAITATYDLVMTNIEILGGNKNGNKSN